MGAGRGLVEGKSIVVRATDDALNVGQRVDARAAGVLRTAARQVDGHGHAGIAVVGDVVARAAVKRVVAHAAAEYVVAAAAGKDVRTQVTNEHVVELGSGHILKFTQRIIPVRTRGSSGRQVDIHTTRCRSVAGRVAARAADERVIAGSAVQYVVAGSAGQRVGRRIAAQLVVIVRAEHVFDVGQRVVPGCAGGLSGGQIDLDAARGRSVAGRIGAGSAVQSIVARAAVERVIARAAAQRVRAGIAGEGVVVVGARSILDADKRIAACGARRGARSEVDGDSAAGGRVIGRVGAAAALETVIAQTTVKRVVAGATRERVGGGTADQRVVIFRPRGILEIRQRVISGRSGGRAGTEVDGHRPAGRRVAGRVGARATIERVIARTAVEHIIAAAAAHRVCVRVAGERVVVA